LTCNLYGAMTADVLGKIRCVADDSKQKPDTSPTLDRIEEFLNYAAAKESWFRKRARRNYQFALACMIAKLVAVLGLSYCALSFRNEVVIAILTSAILLIDGVERSLDFRAKARLDSEIAFHIHLELTRFRYHPERHQTSDEELRALFERVNVILSLYRYPSFKSAVVSEEGTSGTGPRGHE
jgi:hypothetical protein